MIDIAATFQQHMNTVASLHAMIPEIEKVAKRMSACIRHGGKILWMGNGGSAADSQHLAAELVGRFTRERAGLASIALTTDTSILTAVGNDYGYDAIFSRQVEALARPGDVVVGITTSGNSPNILRAFDTADALGVETVAFSGRDGGEAAKRARSALTVSAKETARIQECHILIGHILCDWIEKEHALRVQSEAS
ncbi:MAG: D-sedoheptulose 7-phosphate isomerase [Magnetococcales bacterium]|nr:D-sedoheptulose 7-phosphate isomerase [Magnetococcales bacterium]